MLRPIIFGIIFFGASGYFIYSVMKFISYLKIAKPENRLFDIPKRIRNTIEVAFLQTKLLRSRLAGILHLCIYWGFVVLLFVVVESIIEGFFPSFSFAFLGPLYNVMTVLQDYFGALVLVTVIFSLFRRYIGTPKRLQVERSAKLDATFILIMIGLVMVTMFGMSVEKILIGSSLGYRPVSTFIAGFFNGGSETAYEIFFWAHIIVVLVFMNYLPYSKHFHVLSSVANTFFSNYKIPYQGIVLKPINFEDESIVQYGAKDVEDLTWKNLLDGYTCTECGRCTDVCPANTTGKLLNPKLIVTKIRKRTEEKGPLVVNKIENAPGLDKNLVHDYISPQELWACTTCMACVQECPVMIDHITPIVDMRRDLVMMESDFPPEMNTVFRNMENNESPWAFGSEQRNDWIDELSDELTKEGKENHLKKLSNIGSADDLDVVFWSGCAGAFDKRYRNVTKSFAELLNRARRINLMSYLFTSESVSEGHPDKVADQISDALIDNFLAFDPESKVACETLVTTGQVVLAGEVKSKAYLDVQTIAREVIRKIGYTKSEYMFEADSCGVLSAIHEQSGDINQGVDKKKKEEQGAGDQGMMFGYATNETADYMPITLDLSQKLLSELAELRRENKQIKYLRPDSKSQVTLEYDEDGKPLRIDSIVISTQHDDFAAEAPMQKKIKTDVVNILIPRLIKKYPKYARLLMDKKITYHVNPTGKFVIGGPHGDTGLTGRKIIVDTYGGKGAHGGGAFSGKDPSKVDRSAAYATRHIAKNLVAAGVCDEILVQVSYAIGVAKPMGINVNTYGTGKVNMSDSEIAKIVEGLFDMRPYFIEQRLKLRSPIYSETAAYGHMGRKNEKVKKTFRTPGGIEKKINVELFTWEKLDYVEKVKKAIK
jgi:S-adenosylmethionine synthetase